MTEYYSPNMTGKAGWLYGVEGLKGYFYKPKLRGSKVVLEKYLDEGYIPLPLKFTPSTEDEVLSFYEEEEDSYEVDWSDCPSALFWKEKKGKAYFIGIKWQLLDDGTLLYQSFKQLDESYNGEAMCDGEVVSRYKELVE